jgi:NAD(P)-dependent dehydrogenase (short-subunit alcohol dehydrogenase family)
LLASGFFISVENEFLRVIRGIKMEIKNKVAIVTGGASGLGRACVERFVEHGAAEQGKALSDSLGENASFAEVDVCDEQNVKDAIEQTLKDFGGLHILVNCAGIGMAGKTYGSKGVMPLDLFKLTININLVGSFNVLRLAAEKFAENQEEEKGVIINTASVAAFDGQIGQAAYSASKGGVVGMTLPIARDLSPLGIRVMTIAPGVLDTPLMALLPDEKRQPLVDMVQSPKRLGYPSEFAQLAQHIVENSYLNGETIRLDGGIRMQPR